MRAKQFDDDYEWILYDRISDDRYDERLGVKRQGDDGKALVDRLGGKVLDECVDNDLTAFDQSSGYRPRPEYERLCDLLRSGEPGRRGVIAWHTDRLHRTPRELEDFIDLVEDTGAAVQTVKAGPIDLSTPSGRMIARQLCAVARFESEHKAERIRRKVVELAEAGTIANGGPRPFGYTRIFFGEGKRRRIIRDEVNEAEADIIRDCAKRVLEGDSLRSIVRDLNQRGIKTTTVGQPRPKKRKVVRLNADGTPELSDGRWSQQGLRTLLYSGRIAGLREHKRQIVGAATWPAIIDLETHEQLRAVLDQNERHGVPPTVGWARKYYLTGWVFCGNCLAKNLKMKAKSHNNKTKYVCIPKAEGGCNGRVIGVAELERFMDLYMVKKMNDPKTLRELAARRATDDRLSAGLVKRIESDERRLKFLRASLADGDEDELPEVVASVRQVRQRLASLRQQLGRVTRIPELADQSLPELAVLWPDLPLERKRGLLALFVDRIVIGPGRRGLGRFDPSRIDVIPR